MIVLSKVRQKIDMFVWMSGFHNPLAHTHFNMFVDEWTSANESLGIAGPMSFLGVGVGMGGGGGDIQGGYGYLPPLGVEATAVGRYASYWNDFL